MRFHDFLEKSLASSSAASLYWGDAPWLAPQKTQTQRGFEGSSVELAPEQATELVVGLASELVIAVQARFLALRVLKG